jgi:PAS domain S-box-containing protein
LSDSKGGSRWFLVELRLQFSLEHRIMKLRSQLIVFGVVTVVPVFLVVAVLVWWTASLQRGNTKRTIWTATRALSLALDGELRRAEAILLTLAASPEIDHGDFASVYRQAASLSGTGAWIALIRPDHVQVFNTLRPFGDPLPLAVGTNPSWGIIEAGRTFVSDLFVGALAQRAIVSVDVPVVRGGSVRYAIAMAFGPERFAQLLTEEQLPDDWSAAIVDRKGATIASTRDAGGLALGPGPEGPVESPLTGDGWIPSTPGNGLPVYHEWTTSGMSGWRVGVAVPQPAMAAPVRRVLWVVGGAGAVFVVAVAGAALVFGRRIGGAIRDVVDSANALGHGDEIRVAAPSRVPELDTVHHALRSAYRALRERAAERERFLTEHAARQAAEQSAAALRASEERLNLALGMAKKAEAAARDSAAILTAVSEATTDPIFVKDRQGRMLVANPATLRALGKDASDVIGKTDIECIGPERGRTLMENDRQVMETGRAEIFEEFPAPGMTFLANKTPYRDEHGNVIGIIGIARDVTEQKRIEAEHEALRRQLETVTSNATLALFMADAAQRCTFMNPAAEQMIGYTLAELRDRPFHETIHHTRPDGSPYPVSACPIGQAVARGEPRRGEEVFVHRDGRFIPIAYAASPLRQDGRIVGVVLEVRDVTAEKRAEAERADLLGREQRAREEAEAATRAKDDFLATLSHELRTPLNAMLGWIRLLQRGSLDDGTSRRALDIIARNVETQTQLITDLLDVSRIVSGKMALERQPVDVARVVNAAVDAIAPAADVKGISIVVDLAKGCTVLGDATRLQQVVWNLLSNAVKFTPPGGHVRVDLTRSSRALHLVVSDTGQGIDADFLPRIFDRFRQADSGQTREHTGLGLGLAIVRHLVELHGGTVSAQSGGVGAGTQMSVDLPADESGTLCERDAATGRDWLGGRSGCLTGVKIMVVDDNVDTLDLLTTILTSEGAVVSRASSGPEALEKFQTLGPDLLISDIGMPGMTGYDLVRRLRQRSRDDGGDVPAVALTAYARLDDREEALAAGFHAYLCKPATPLDLVATILPLLGRNGTTSRDAGTAAA